MTFREAIDAPFGLRWMYETLELQSGAGRRMLLESEMMTDRDEIGGHYGKLREILEKVAVSAEAPLVRTLQVRLGRLRDIRGTISRLAGGAVPDDVELFELKNMLLLAGEVRGMLKEAAVETVSISPLYELPLRVLDPDGQRVPSFHIYDSYSEELASFREEIRRNDSEELLVRALAVEDKVRAQVAGVLRGHSTTIWITFEVLAELDVLLAQAVQMHRLGLTFPEASGSAETKYRRMFHPQVAALLAAKGAEFQPVDISLDGRPVTIVGANMGGKTVVLKMLGLCQCLFQFGFGVPAAEAQIAIKSVVRWSIGEQDRSEQGLSSFGAEISMLDEMIRAAREGECNLTLIDEPARTTNPIEGTALVESLLHVMNGHGIDLVLTTHYNLKETPGRRLRVRGLVGGEMDYALEETTEGHVPHEAVAIAESLGADPEWMARTKEILAAE